MPADSASVGSMKIQNECLYRFTSTAMAIGLMKEPTRHNVVMALR